MTLTEIKYQELCSTPSDIHEHLPTLKKYASECEHVTEMGVRWIVSTWALLAAKPTKLISYDIENPNKWGANINEVHDAAKEENVNYSFIQASTLEVDIEPTDFLFIDTWHVYDQLKAELTKHHINVRKYIVMHDTTSYAYFGESAGYNGLVPAINEFVDENPEWIIHEEHFNNNGLTILKRNEYIS